MKYTNKLKSKANVNIFRGYKRKILLIQISHFFQGFQMSFRFFMPFQTTPLGKAFLAWIASEFPFLAMNSRYMLFESFFCGIEFVTLWTFNSSDFMNGAKV